MATLHSDRAADSKLLRWWRPAWAPGQTILKYAFGSIFVGLVLVVPGGILFAQAALLLPIISVLVGICLGALVWYRSYRLVSRTHTETLTGCCCLEQEGGVDSNIYISELSTAPADTRLPVASEYSLTVVELTPEWSSITEVVLDPSDFAVSNQEVRIPAHKIQSQSFDDGTVHIVSDRGNWEVDNVAPIHEQDNFLISGWC